MTLRIQCVLAALLLGSACAAPTADSEPITVSDTRVLPYPSYIVRGAVPDAIAGLGPGRWSYAAGGQRDSFHAVTESGLTVSITSEPSGPEATSLNVVIVGEAAAARWFLFVIPGTIGDSAARIEPALSQLGYVGSEESDQ